MSATRGLSVTTTLLLAATLAAAPGGQSWLGDAPPAPPPSEAPEEPRPPPTPPATPDEEPAPPPPRVERLAHAYSVPTGASVWSMVPLGPRRLAVAQADGRAAVYDLASLRRAGGSHWPSAGRVLAVATTGPGSWSRGYGVAAGGDGGFVSVSGRGGFPAHYFQPGGEVWGLAFRPDARRLAAIGEFDGVREWRTDLPTGHHGEGQAPPFRVLGETGPVHCDLRYSPDGTRLYASSDFQDRDVRVRVLDAGPEARGEVAAYRGHVAPVRGLDLSPDGRWLATGSYDRTLRVWDTTTGEGQVLATFEEDVNGVAFDPTGAWVAAGIDDGTLAIVERASAEELVRFPAHRGHISAVTFTPDGQFLLSGGLEPLVRAFSTAELR